MHKNYCQDFNRTGKSRKTREFLLTGKNREIFYFIAKYTFLSVFFLRLLALCALGEKFHFKKYLIHVAKVCKNITSFNIYHLQSVIENKIGTYK